ncbi:rod shape-determining protein MreC [Weissella paramesenteroides]|uniref:Cell shape-determining protein MreC n=1 Tax=Weissella paramesenteroides TaxID=1249 RepID=A0ABD4XIZ7_WEIPA|nr:rod shape-determining protein MreC [Weissella paramesenteroides]KAA8439045.1 rod shape-determining protein MreC [Weissella paramesenteroides]KAA8440247.1 rod shape-determining protein MreC [Weissella paramesenteroides]KAA8443842.1 rod shape-determining protein MreC [Weissella paramesenteroides]KAA8444933.1 rod shape-determining protein MreC [Weissella paramesenteroides]KAA8448964.1 rod shape-determining protein MreC [Weissella paramesenteroides]
MKNIFTSRRLVIGVIVVIVAIGAITLGARAHNSEKEPSLPVRVISDVSGWTSNIVNAPIRAIKGGFDSIDELMNTYQENDRLTKKVDDLAQTKVQLQVLQQENRALKDQLKISDTLTDYKVVNAVVTSRSPSNWQTQLIIDKGTNAGLKKGLSVMGSGGLIGRITQVNTTNAKVELLSDNSQVSDRFAIRVQNSAGETVDGIITSFNQSKNLIVMGQITSSVSVKKGDLVTTSGLGGVTPSGLYVGKVEKVGSDNYGLSKKIYIKPATDFNNIPVVSVAIP